MSVHWRTMPLYCPCDHLSALPAQGTTFFPPVRFAGPPPLLSILVLGVFPSFHDNPVHGSILFFSEWLVSSIFPFFFLVGVLSWIVPSLPAGLFLWWVFIESTLLLFDLSIGYFCRFQLLVYPNTLPPKILTFLPPFFSVRFFPPSPTPPPTHSCEQTRLWFCFFLTAPIFQLFDFFQNIFGGMPQSPNFTHKRPASPYWPFFLALACRVVSFSYYGLVRLILAS